MSEKEKRAAAAILVQCIYRGYVERKAHAAEYHKINLKFEISILEERCRRRGLFVGFLQRARRPPPCVRAAAHASDAQLQQHAECEA